MVLQVSMECRFFAHLVVSIDGMSPPRGFGCKNRLSVASLLNGVASIDGMSLPCSFCCEYRWNIASSRIWVQVSTKRRLPAFSKNFVMRVSMKCRFPTIFEVLGFFEPLFLFWNLSCGYQLKCCVYTVFFFKFYKYRRGVAFLRF